MRKGFKWKGSAFISSSSTVLLVNVDVSDVAVDEDALVDCDCDSSACDNDCDSSPSFVISGVFIPISSFVGLKGDDKSSILPVAVLLLLLLLACVLADSLLLTF